MNDGTNEPIISDKERRKNIREKARLKAYLRQKEEFEKSRGIQNDETKTTTTINNEDENNSKQIDEKNLTAVERAFVQTRKIVDGGQQMLGATITGATVTAQQAKNEKQKEESKQKLIAEMNNNRTGGGRGANNQVVEAVRASINTQNPTVAADILNNNTTIAMEKNNTEDVKRVQLTSQDISKEMNKDNKDINNTNYKTTSSGLRAKINSDNKVEFWTEEQWYNKRRDKLLRLVVLMVCTFVIILAMGGMALISWRTHGHWYSPPPGHSHAL